MGKVTVHKTLLEALSNIRWLDRRKLPLLTARTVVSVCLSYLYVALTSVVVDCLTSRQPLERILAVALSGLLAVLLVSVLSHALEGADQLHDQRALRAFRTLKSRRLMEMDFSLLEEAKTRETLARMRTEEGVGFGLSSLLTYLGILAQQALMAAISAAMLIALVGMYGGGLYFLWTALFVAVTVGLSSLAAAMAKRANDASLAAIRSKFPPHIIINDHLHNERGIRYQDGKDIRLYRYHGQLDRIYRDALDEMHSFDRAGGRLPALAAGLGGLVQGLTLCASYLFVLLVWSIRLTDLGWALLLAAAIWQLTAAIGGVAAVLSRCCAAADSVNGSMRFLSAVTPAGGAREKGIASDPPEEDMGPVLEVKDLTFRYPGTERDVLRHVSLTLERGSRTALVGVNGCGKTTLVKVLCGLYQPEEGQLLLHGRDWREIPREVYQDSFSVVFQDFQLLSLPLGEVVAASADYRENEVLDALRRAGCASLAQRQAAGLEACLYQDYSDGIDLSGGEAQKAAFARALYRDAPILILDEPTAALDPMAESELYEHISGISDDKTVLFISHRLSSCRFCHQVIVLSGGEIVQRGNHDELVRQEGLYRDMWNAQARYYDGGNRPDEVSCGTLERL